MGKAPDYEKVGKAKAIVDARSYANFQQAARILGLSHVTVHKYVRLGAISTIRLGARNVILNEELQRFQREGARVSLEPNSDSPEAGELRRIIKGKPRLTND